MAVVCICLLSSISVSLLMWSHTELKCTKLCPCCHQWRPKCVDLTTHVKYMTVLILIVIVHKVLGWQHTLNCEHEPEGVVALGGRNYLSLGTRPYYQVWSGPRTQITCMQEVWNVLYETKQHIRYFLLCYNPNQLPHGTPCWIMIKHQWHSKEENI